VQASEARGPDIVTYSDVKALVRNSLYKPLREFVRMAQLLAEISRGNGSSFVDYKNEGRKPLHPPSRSCHAGRNAHDCDMTDDDWTEVPPAILCADCESVVDWTPEAFKAYWKVLQNQSEAIEGSWASIRMACVGWNVRPK